MVFLFERRCYRFWERARLEEIGEARDDGFSTDRRRIMERTLLVVRAWGARRPPKVRKGPVGMIANV